jgi:predicted FMN-binding regulatory protein PaiB
LHIPKYYREEDHERILAFLKQNNFPALDGVSQTLGGWFKRSVLYNSDMSVVKEHMLIHSILPKKEERC